MRRFSSGGTAVQPKIVLFGDSISSSVGYGKDSKSDTTYGSTVADILSKQFGTNVDSQASGGLTTQDVLSGQALPGGKSYEEYLKEQNPNVVLLRYGAADAIRLNDPSKTLANLQQMVDLAKQYGATPILIGVSPFAAGNDIRAGNINEWSVDPYINSANEINLGIQQLAGQNQLPFVDVRSLEAPKGSLLDGVHPTADFGKQMAEFIGQNVAAALPQFQFETASSPATSLSSGPAPEQTQSTVQPPVPYYVTGLAGVQRPVDPTTGYMYETEVGGNRMRGWGGGDLSVRDGQIYEGEELPYYMRLQNNRMVATGAQAPAPAPVFGEPPKGLASLVQPNTQLADLAQQLSSLPSSPPQPTPPTPIPPEPDMFDTTEQFGNIQNGITMPENYRRGGRVRMI